MSLFDSIKFIYPLPSPSELGELTQKDLQEAVFQTKDLDCCLSYYEVDESGQLLIERRETQYVEGSKKGKTFSERFGHLKTLKSWFEPVNLTCTVKFYDYHSNDKNENDYSIDYQAEFVAGKVASIKILKFEKTPNADRKARDLEWKAKMAASHEFRKRWYIKYLYIPYERAVRWIFRKYNRIKQKLPHSYKVERFLTPL